MLKQTWRWGVYEYMYVWGLFIYNVLACYLVPGILKYLYILIGIYVPLMTSIVYVNIN